MSKHEHTTRLAVQSRMFTWVKRHRVALIGLFVGVLLPLWIFGTLAEDVSEHQSFFFDAPILLFMHAHASPTLDSLMLFFSLVGYRFGVVPFDIGLLIFLLWRRRRGDAFFWFVAVAGSAVLNLAAKHSFERVRPDLWLSIAPETTFSFPSGHAMGSMALAAGLIVLAWPTQWRWLAVIGGGVFAVLVGVSRVYLGVHYPSDILAGWMASLAWVFGVSSILYHRITKPTPRAEPTTAAS